MSARLQSSEERGQVAEESIAQHSAAAEQLRKDLADALSYQQRLRDQLLNTSLQLADVVRSPSHSNCQQYNIALPRMYA